MMTTSDRRALSRTVAPEQWNGGGSTVAHRSPPYYYVVRGCATVSPRSGAEQHCLNADRRATRHSSSVQAGLL